MNESASFSIKIIRITATLMIFLCHIVYLFGNTIGTTSQFFNIGVDIFITISAYIFSLRDVKNLNVFRWYKRRVLRISIPYYIFLILAFITYSFTNTHVDMTTKIDSVFLINGITENYLPGAAHLWFLTFILISYIITPVLYKIKKCDLKINLLVSICLILVYFFVALYTKDIYGTIYINVLEYIIIFLFVGRLFELINMSNITYKKIIVEIFLIFVLCLFKLIFNIFFDNTIIYSKFLVPFIDTLIGLSIFILIFNISSFAYPKFKNLHVLSSIINNLDSISFEFYLVHYFFIAGPISLINISNPLIDSLLILLVSYFCATILHFFCSLFFKVIKKWTK